MLAKKLICVGIIIMLLLLTLISCGKKETASTIEEINEMEKGQQDMTEIKDKLEPETNINELQTDTDLLDDW